MTDKSFIPVGGYRPYSGTGEQNAAERPFKPDDILQLKTGGRGYRYLRDAPDRPGYIICEYWGPKGMVEKDFLASDMQHIRLGTIFIRTQS